MFLSWIWRTIEYYRNLITFVVVLTEFWCEVPIVGDVCTAAKAMHARRCLCFVFNGKCLTNGNNCNLNTRELIINSPDVWWISRWKFNNKKPIMNNKRNGNNKYYQTCNQKNMIEKYKITKLHDTLVEVYNTKVMKLFIIPIILVTATATESIVNSIPKSTHYSSTHYSVLR